MRLLQRGLDILSISWACYINKSDSNQMEKVAPLQSRVILAYNGYYGAIVPRKIQLPDFLLSFLAGVGLKIERSSFFNGDTERFLRCVWKHGKTFQYNAPDTDIPLPRGGFPNL